VTQLSDNLLLTVIDQIYAAALEPQQWQRVLQSLSHVCGAQAAILFGMDRPTQRVAFAHVAGIPDDVLNLYDREYVAIDVRMQKALLRGPGRVSTEQTLFEPRELEQSRIYNEFLVRHDFPHILGAFPLNSDSTIVTVSLNRSALCGPFRLDEQRFLQCLMPHLQRAALVSTKLEENVRIAKLSLAALDHVPFGIVILDGNNQVLEINAAARAIVDRRDGLAMRGKHLEIAGPSSNSEFSRLVRAVATATTESMRIAPVTLSIPRRSGGQPYRLVAIPIADATQWCSAGAARVLVAIYDTTRPFHSPGTAFMAVYGMTAAESRVTECLMAGDQPAQVSEKLGISMNTVRTHLKSIYLKVGVRSQSLLMRELLLGPACGSLAHSS
jgi:DNA-binding CsgD family transcriptional regulator/PAS domain-containing protein